MGRQMILLPEFEECAQRYIDEASTYRTAKITAFLSSPIALTMALHFDGLLSYAVGREELGNEKFFNLKSSSELWEIPLPLVKIGKTFQFWNCSIGFPKGETAEGFTTWTKRIATEQLEWLKSQKAKIRTDLGPFKAFQMPLNYIDVRELVFFVKGAPDEIIYLCRQYIRFIGKKHSQGFGFISKWEYENCDGDAYIREGRLTRNVPIEEIQIQENEETIRGFYSCYPPYWHPMNMTECWLPGTKIDA